MIIDLHNPFQVEILFSSQMRALFLSSSIIFFSVHADPCPNGYTQAPNGGDCYKIKSYYDTFMHLYFPKTFDEVARDCQSDGGGFLASMHNAEENEFIQSLIFSSPYCSQTMDTLWTNFGLRCTGKDCKWDDGTPVTYTNFENGKAPCEDGRTWCYGMDSPFTSWINKDCSKTYPSDCWVCSAHAKPQPCPADETAYNGGCVSVHTSPLDQKSAETSCPGGGHLVSIHGQEENFFYAGIALKAGVSGTVYIGGQFSNGVFEWMDGSNVNMNNWANGFPNSIFGSCVQMLLASEFGVQDQWTNSDCSVKQPYICFRNANGPTEYPPPTKAAAKCPPIQYYTEGGFIYSPDYPQSIPSQQSCEYVLGVDEGTRVRVNFPVFNCQSGTSLALYDGVNSEEPFITYTSKSPPPDQWYMATSNVMKIVFSSNGPSAPVGTGWAATFIGV
ncbi:hypothetical protein PENTCL1PPCAC_21006 [Pristionchus entomophagus]|uniref:CUB domain-containing protein n=1 Tax=Pristionchus entomophagus TaxID=358040 RepID=A0AAV5TX31_9BILA|nr:hypothetical protein PENTCL1PPCAC_21006 [Pristionchus entomophagus]